MSETVDTASPEDVFEVPSVDITAPEYDRYCKAAARQQTRDGNHHGGFLAAMAGIPIGLAAGAIAVLAGVVPDRDSGGLIAVLAFAAYFAGLWINYALSWRRYGTRVKETYRTEAPRWQGTRIVIDSTGVAMTGPHNTSHWRWSGVQDVWVAAGFIIFRVSTNNSVMFPARLFTDAQRHRLLAFAHARIAAAKSKPVV